MTQVTYFQNTLLNFNFNFDWPVSHVVKVKSI